MASIYSLRAQAQSLGPATWRHARAMAVEHRELLLELAWREVRARSRGSILGAAWSLVTPLLMLALYTFVFSVVFEGRWNLEGDAGRIDFALALFSGLIVFNVFSEVINAAPGLVLGNANYVKRVVFPLEVLPLARLASCLVQAMLSLAVLLAVQLVAKGTWPWTLVFLPLVLLPLVLLVAGLGWFLASLGVFLRDIGNLVAPVTNALLFLSPIFYPITRLPASLQPVLVLNPLAPILDAFRRVTVECRPPDWTSWLAVTAVSALVAWCGLAWFVRSKNAFADVL